jgi:triacylglycerol lipase
MGINRTIVSGATLALGAALTFGSPHRAPGQFPAAAQGDRELVVVVHGLGRTELSMLPLAFALEREGFEVLNWGYSSVCCSVAELGRELRHELDRHPLASSGRVHFVGHSMGNIVVRWLLANDPPARPGHVVMLAPPNQGSSAADRFAPMLGWLLTPLSELTTDSRSTARNLPVPTGIPIGVIAGRYDQRVTLEESRLTGSSAFAVVPATHTFLMLRADVRRLTIDFLRTGRFDPPARSSRRESPTYIPARESS